MVPRLDRSSSHNNKHITILYICVYRRGENGQHERKRNKKNLIWFDLIYPFLHSRPYSSMIFSAANSPTRYAVDCAWLLCNSQHFPPLQRKIGKGEMTKYKGQEENIYRRKKMRVQHRLYCLRADTQIRDAQTADSTHAQLRVEADVFVVRLAHLDGSVGVPDWR